MANEKEVKTGTVAPVCSVTGLRCSCGSSGRCESRSARGRLDPVPTETIRHLRAARLLLDGAKTHLDAIQDPYLMRRTYPQPEVREIRRKLETAQAMIDELGGEL